MPVLPDAQAVLVTDFDGTLTDRDFYRLVVDRLVPPGTPDFWADYRRGRLTHFDALNRYFAAAPAGADALLGLTRDMGLEPGLPRLLAELRAEGWDVVVVSAGCSWYIGRLLAAAGVTLEFHANPGHLDARGRLVMRRPIGSPFYSQQTGVDKAAVVRAAGQGGRPVAFAGDGPPDLEPARLVPPDRRFARRGSPLAAALDRLGEPFHPFDRWAEVARALLQRPNADVS